MSEIAKNIAEVRAAIIAAAQEFRRDPGCIRLLAVSKTHSAAAVRAAIDAGQHDFGENYLQEALGKIQALRGTRACWHFIGPIQSNKTRDLAAHFDWVQSVDRERIARRLNEHRSPEQAPLNICLQVNIDREAQKAGLAPEDVARMAEIVQELPRLKLRGLMAIPAAREDFEGQRDAFARVRQLFDSLRADGHALDTLSIGMSGDLRAAIAEGSTMLRIGTAIFGARQRS